VLERNFSFLKKFILTLRLFLIDLWRCRAFSIFSKCHLSWRSFPVDILKVGLTIIPSQVFDIRIYPIRLEISQMYIDRVLNISMLIMETLYERLKVDYWTTKINGKILLKVLYCRSFLIYISWMSKIKTEYFFSKRL